MNNLRILIIRKAQFSTGPKYLPNSLRRLEWDGYPSTELPPNFSPNKLVVFKLCYSPFRLEEPFKRFEYLTRLNFSHCEFITEVPDMSQFQSLRRLLFKGCYNLIKVHDSVGFLAKLVQLDLQEAERYIPHLPSNLQKIGAENCISLTTKSLGHLWSQVLQPKNMENIEFNSPLVSMNAPTTTSLKRRAITSPPNEPDKKFLRKLKVADKGKLDKTKKASRIKYQSIAIGRVYRSLGDSSFSTIIPWRKGINAFIDDKKLGKAERISPTLLKAIEKSRISIIVFSMNYATSTCCLDELAHIIRCKAEKNQMVMPIFYKVDPMDVQYQRNSFGEAMAAHEVRFGNDLEKVRIWCLKLLVCHRYGFSNMDMNRMHILARLPPKRLHNIARLPPKRLHNIDYMVGLEPRFEELMSLLGESDYSVCMLGIHGTGGIGKTTLAKAFLRRLSFNDCYNLIKIHDSVGSLSKLVALNVGGCIKLTSFPREINMPFLQDIMLSHCKSLDYFPHIVGTMHALSYVWADDTSIKELPPSFENLTGLESLKKLTQESEQVISCANMEFLMLENCSLLDEDIHLALNLFPNLVQLYLSGNEFVSLPECLKDCGRLVKSVVTNCNRLRDMPELPSNMPEVEPENCVSLTAKSLGHLWTGGVFYWNDVEIQVPCLNPDIPVVKCGVYVYRQQTNIENIQFKSPVMLTTNDSTTSLEQRAMSSHPSEPDKKFLRNLKVADKGKLDKTKKASRRNKRHQFFHSRCKRRRMVFPMGPGPIAECFQLVRLGHSRLRTLAHLETSPWISLILAIVLTGNPYSGATWKNLITLRLLGAPYSLAAFLINGFNL
ncbi:probable disease resistance protein RPP1 [Neltuma alba]|uniref:probable disease resistance protein RPP1 n=1 Tax=Neltuma alba TaxID=207710 RepID=UPI0010A50CD7|nr:probable disease resistance protein RPP1 [Prosopis alba]